MLFPHPLYAHLPNASEAIREVRALAIQLAAKLGISNPELFTTVELEQKIRRLSQAHADHLTALKSALNDYLAIYVRHEQG